MKSPVPFIVSTLLISTIGCRVAWHASGNVEVQTGGDDVLHAGLEHPAILGGGDGSDVLGIVVRPAEVPAAGQADKVALALVVDVSGSMSGHKIEHARSAARAVVDSLGDGDELSIIAFDDVAEERLPLVRLDPATRKRAEGAVEGLRDRGSTALFDGVRRGLDSLAAAQNPVRRLVLLSDGRANVGPSTPDAIVAGLARPTWPVTISSLGVGTDYDESVMMAVATHGGGTFHHLTDPVQLKGILEEELKLARAVAGTGAVVEIIPAPGVTVETIAGIELTRAPDGTLFIPIGDLYAGERRALALPVKVPVQNRGIAAFGQVRLRYSAPGTTAAPILRELAVHYDVTASTEEAGRAAATEIVVAADRMRAAHALTDAAALIKEGDLIEAQSILRDERARLVARRDRVTGPDRADVEALINVLRAPYIDANLAPSTQSPQSANPAKSPTHTFDLLVEQAQKGQPLPEPDLAALDKDRLRILRNVPYARHGYPFKSDDLDRWFAARPWYKADHAFDNARLTRADEDNIALVRKYEGRAALSAAAIVTPAPAARRGPGFDVLLDRAARGEALGDSLLGLDLGQLRILRNACYARHGRTFRAADLQTAFGKLSWYKPDPTYTEERLTSQDQGNIQSIKSEEQLLVARAGTEAVRDFQLQSRAGAWQVMRP